MPWILKMIEARPTIVETVSALVKCSVSCSLIRIFQRINITAMVWFNTISRRCSVVSSTSYVLLWHYQYIPHI